MQAREVVRRVTTLVQPLCEQAGVALWDVEFEKEGGQHMLTVTIDRAGGVEIDQCETVSRALDPLLDAPEFDSLPSYTLCVSSAGLERRLVRPEHFAQFLGETVTVRFFGPIDGARSVCGTLKDYDNGSVTLESDGVTRVYEPKDIASVRLTVTV